MSNELLNTFIIDDLIYNTGIGCKLYFVLSVITSLIIVSWLIAPPRCPQPPGTEWVSGATGWRWAGRRRGRSRTRRRSSGPWRPAGRGRWSTGCSAGSGTRRGRGTGAGGPQGPAPPPAGSCSKARGRWRGRAGARGRGRGRAQGPGWDRGTQWSAAPGPERSDASTWS